MFEKRLAERDRRLQAEALQQGLREGLQEGLQEGIQKGHREGEARVLLRQLERKFGPLDAPSRERIAAADPERLLDWADRILEASRLQGRLRRLSRSRRRRPPQPIRPRAPPARGCPAAEMFRPRLRYHLVDEGSYPVEELRSKRSLPAALFWLERMPPPEEIRQALAQFMGPLRDPEDRDLAKTFADCIQAPGLLGPGEIPDGLPVGGYRIMFEKRLAERDRRLQAEALQQGLREGLREGLQEGIQKGHREGEARLLLRQLERKFGPLDAPSRERIAAADPERLLDWADRILEASRLQDVFGD
jgi:uncharacterized protein with von Willebrand factor type A (vWA) domain